jgi:tetratricopeptide (TPR) repeat protein
MKPDARAHYERGLNLYAEKDYAAAIAEFERGYLLDPRREFLFAEAQAKRLAGDCKGAVPLYQQFLSKDPPGLQVDATRMGLARCAEQLAAEAEAAAVARQAPPPAPAVPPPPPPPPPPQPPPPWHRDKLAAALTATGVVGVGVGIGFWLASSNLAGEPQEPFYAGYQDRRERAESRRRIAIVSLTAGAVLAAAAAARYGWLWRRGRRWTVERAMSASASAWLDLDTALPGLVVKGRF